VASYSVNPVAIEHARELIAKRQYMLRRHKAIELAAHELLQLLDEIASG
jgi:hypothetical protein